jgi:glucose/arabinose dehydrogenase
MWRAVASLQRRDRPRAGGSPLRRSPAGGLVAALALLAAAPSPAQTVTDPSLTVTAILPNFSLAQPTSMAFVAPDDFLVLEKATGRVRRVQGGALHPTDPLDVAVNASSERGLLGIAVNTETPPAVFLYYTEAATDGGTPLGNRVYRYTWNAGSGLLESGQLILDLPVTTGPNHDGGVLVMGRPSDGGSAGDGAFLYAVIGDLNRNGKLQNNAAGADPDDTGVILRVEQDGSPAPGNPFTPWCSGATALACDEDADCGGSGPCVLEAAGIYAYGVRNSFGMALDPLTDALWMTENGPASYDELNRVEPGLNSGWNDLMGPDARDPQGLADLWNVPGAGSTYGDPEFSWLATIAPTGVALPHGSRLGDAYDDRVLVGDSNLGQLYAFPLDAGRTALDLTGASGVADLVADSAAERDQFRIGSGFGAITDLEIGPERALYVVSIARGTVYRIEGPPPGPPAVPALAGAALAALGLALAGAGAAALAGGRRARTG